MKKIRASAKENKHRGIRNGFHAINLESLEKGSRACRRDGKPVFPTNWFVLSRSKLSKEGRRRASRRAKSEPVNETDDPTGWKSPWSRLQKVRRVASRRWNACSRAGRCKLHAFRSVPRRAITRPLYCRRKVRADDSDNRLRNALKFLAIAICRCDTTDLRESTVKFTVLFIRGK